MKEKEISKEVGPGNVDWCAYVDMTIGKKHPVAARVLKRTDIGYDPEDHTLVMSLRGLARGPVEHIALLRIDVAEMLTSFSKLIGMEIELV